LVYKEAGPLAFTAVKALPACLVLPVTILIDIVSAYLVGARVDVSVLIVAVALIFSVPVLIIIRIQRSAAIDNRRQMVLSVTLLSKEK